MCSFCIHSFHRLGRQKLQTTPDPLQQRANLRFELGFSHLAGMILANQTLPVDNHQRRRGADTVALVVHHAHRHQYAGEKAVVLVADLDDVTQFVVG